MPQTRDAKTGRYTSGGGSSVGGAAGTNARVQKAKAVGGGATAGGASAGGSSPAIQSKKAISQSDAEKMFNAPKGTVIEVSHHSSGDYVGEFTRTSDGWAGSQKYRSSYTIPKKVTTAKGFAMQVAGTDVRVK